MSSSLQMIVRRVFPSSLSATSPRKISSTPAPDRVFAEPADYQSYQSASSEESVFVAAGRAHSSRTVAPLAAPQEESMSNCEIAVNAVSEYFCRTGNNFCNNGTPSSCMVGNDSLLHYVAGSVAIVPGVIFGPCAMIPGGCLICTVGRPLQICGVVQKEHLDKAFEYNYLGSIAVVTSVFAIPAYIIVGGVMTLWIPCTINDAIKNHDQSSSPQQQSM